MLSNPLLAPPADSNDSHPLLPGRSQFQVSTIDPFSKLRELLFWIYSRFRYNSHVRKCFFRILNEFCPCRYPDVSLQSSVAFVLFRIRSKGFRTTVCEHAGFIGGKQFIAGLRARGISNCLIDAPESSPESSEGPPPPPPGGEPPAESQVRCRRFRPVT